VSAISFGDLEAVSLEPPPQHVAVCRNIVDNQDRRLALTHLNTPE
jgi:hypothetical protein